MKRPKAVRVWIDAELNTIRPYGATHSFKAYVNGGTLLEFDRMEQIPEPYKARVAMLLAALRHGQHEIFMEGYGEIKQRFDAGTHKAAGVTIYLDKSLGG